MIKRSLPYEFTETLTIRFSVKLYYASNSANPINDIIARWQLLEHNLSDNSKTVLWLNGV